MHLKPNVDSMCMCAQRLGSRQISFQQLQLYESGVMLDE